MQTETKLTVRYAETDQMGVVHHSNYAIWFEVGRTDFLKDIGLSYSKIEANGVMFPLYELQCKFIASAKYEDEITIITTLKSISRSRVCFSYQVRISKDNKLIATGETMHAWTNKAMKPINAQKIVPEIFSVLNQLIN